MFKVLLLLLIAPGFSFAQTTPAAETTAPTAAPTAETPKAEAEKKVSFFDGRFGVVLGYDTASSLRFDSGEYTTNLGTFDFKQKIKTSTVPSVGITFARMHPNAWGFSGTLLYQLPRELKDFSLNGTSKLNLVLIETNMLYRWERVYTPFGINLSIPWVTGGGEKSDTFQPMAGAFGGVGYLLQENVGVEIFARMIGLHGKTVDVSGINVRPGNGFMTGVGVQVKYWF